MLRSGAGTVVVRGNAHGSRRAGAASEVGLVGRTGGDGGYTVPLLPDGALCLRAARSIPGRNGASWSTPWVVESKGVGLPKAACCSWRYITVVYPCDVPALVVHGCDPVGFDLDEGPSIG